MTHSLNQYLELLKSNGLVDDYKISDFCFVDYISYNSADIRENTLFVCKGAHFKEEYLHDALEKGALCYVSEVKRELPADYIIVNNIRRAIALIANFYYENIWDKLNLIGLTGTKGKSTTAYFVKYILDEYMKSEGKPKTGIVSSIDTYDGVVFKESHLTTPEQFELQGHFKNAVDSDIEYMTMEVSSQGLKYDRVYGINYKIGVFLNIGTDHISPVEHPDVEDYFYSKMIIFSQTENAVVNLDTERKDEVLKFASKCKRMITFSEKDESADIYGYNIRKNGNDTVFTVRTPDYTEDFTLTIPGLFNVSNALAAIAVCYALGVPKRAIYVGLMKARSSGRMEIYSNVDNSVIAIVDYAHNQMSFESLFESVRKEFPGRRVSIVFGCPGKKAYQRRKDLGEIAGKYADMTYLTEEDAGEEPIHEISEEIAKYVEGAGGKYEIIDDRYEAIRKSIFDCNEPSVILITGKGNETRQKRGIEYIPVKSDVELVHEYLKEYDASKGNDSLSSIHSRAELVEELSEVKGKSIVIKLGGSVMEDFSCAGEILKEISALNLAGANVCVVHGGGKKITGMLSKLGIESEFKKGYRVTGEDEIDTAEMVLSGNINKELVSILTAEGIKAAGISGRDGGLFTVVRKTVDGEDIGRVGEIAEVNTELCEILFNAGYIPVISPVSSDEEGISYNVNADDAALRLAEKLGAHKLIFVTDVDGIMIDPENSKTVIEELDSKKAKELIEKGFVGGGMIPKLKNCLGAIRKGVSEVTILSGREENNILSCFLKGRSAGTTIKE